MLQPATLLKKTLAQVFSCEFCEIFDTLLSLSSQQFYRFRIQILTQFSTPLKFFSCPLNFTGTISHHSYSTQIYSRYDIDTIQLGHHSLSLFYCFSFTTSASNTPYKLVFLYLIYFLNFFIVWHRLATLISSFFVVVFPSFHFHNTKHTDAYFFHRFLNVSSWLVLFQRA